MDVERLRDKLKVSEEELKLSRQLYEHEGAEKDEKIHHLNMQLESALTDVDIIRKDVRFHLFNFYLFFSKLIMKIYIFASLVT